MQAYQQLLNQFHQQQTWNIDCDNQIKYKQLLNEISNVKKSKQQILHKSKLQSQRLKQKNSQFINHSQISKSLKSSNITYSDTMNQKRNLIELQRDTMYSEINELKQGIQRIKEEKYLLENEIQLLNRNQIQIQNALIESQKNYEELKYLIKQQTYTNQQEWKFYDVKISELTEKLTQINEENKNKAKQYKDNKHEKIQSNAKTIFGSILFFQNHTSKLKQLSKKIYTKNQVQSMLRSLYLILKLSELNYGNIIQHLIIIAEDALEGKQKNKEYSSQNGKLKLLMEGKDKRKNHQQFYIDQNGQQIPINEVIRYLQMDLLSAPETKLLSKMMLIQFFQTNGLIISTSLSTGQFIPETEKLISTVIEHYVKMTSWFSRIEKRNLQLSEYYKDLQKLDDDLQLQINSFQLSATQKHIKNLQDRENQIDYLSEKINIICKIIFKFNINTYDLIKRGSSLNELFDEIVKSTKRRTLKKTYVELEDENSFLLNFSRILFRSPENILLDWNNAMNNHKKQKISSLETLEKLPDNEVFLEKIMKNDLLRIYSTPHVYEFQKSYLYNIERTFTYVIDEEREIIKNLSIMLKNLLSFSKKGIQSYLKKQNTLISQRKMQKRDSLARKIGLKELLESPDNQKDKVQEPIKFKVQDDSTTQPINPFLLFLQKNQANFNKFLTKDEVKEEKPSTYDNNFCVESKQYFRRDNFKVIEKLQRIQLKKKGLYENLPFSVNTSLQLQSMNTTHSTVVVEKPVNRLGSVCNSQRYRSPRFSQQILTNRHNELSQRRQKQNLRRKDLRDLLKNISQIAVDNQKYRIRKKLISKDKQMSLNKFSY